MSREYSKLMSSFWTGRTGRSFRGDPEAQVVMAYLISCPSANMLGMYHIAIPTLAHETGIPLEGASKALRRVSEGGFCRYSEEEESVWVLNFARVQVGESLSEGDKRVKGVHNELAKYRKSPFYNDFLDEYMEDYHLQNLPKSPSPFEAPCKPLRSQEQEQEKEKEEVSDASHPRPLAEPNETPKPKAPAKAKPKPLPDDLSDQIVQAWNEVRSSQGLDRWPQARAPRDKARGNIAARLKECDSPEDFVREYLDRLARMSRSPHYQGANGWAPNMPWVFEPNGWEKAGNLTPADVADTPENHDLDKHLENGGTPDEWRNGQYRDRPMGLTAIRNIVPDKCGELSSG